MKTTYLLLSSALLLGCVSACNTSGQKSKEMKTDDGSITTVETAGSKLTICDLSLVKDTIEVPLSEFVEDCRRDLLQYISVRIHLESKRLSLIERHVYNR